MALPSVPVTMSTRSITPKCSGVPRPPGPTTPTACESSTITSASYSSASSQIRSSRAREPSMEKTPSGAHPPRAGPHRPPQPPLQLIHVAVRVAQPLRLAEADPVDDRRVVELIRDDRVLLGEQRLEEAAVGVEARAEENRVVGAQELREPLLELAVERLCPADEADRGHAVAPAVERVASGCHDRGMVREPEVVVRAEVEQLATLLDLDVRPLRGRHRQLALVGAGLTDLGQRLDEVVAQCSVQLVSS